MKQTPYIRVGTSYYKEVKAPTIAGHFNKILVHWNMETIKQDHGKDHLKFPNMMGLHVFQVILILSRNILVFTISIHRWGNSLKKAI